MLNETKTETSGACEITVLYRNYFNPPREIRYENGKRVEYLYGRRVITHEEMREMDCPVPPEDEEQNPPREFRLENGKRVEYRHGHRVITPEEAREMDFPWPPEDKDQNPIE